MVSVSVQCYLFLVVSVFDVGSLRVDRRQRDLKIVSKSEGFHKTSSQNSEVNELTITGNLQELMAVSKYLTQPFNNYKGYTKIVCERETMKLYCLPGQGIKVIDAFYGRNTEDICYGIPAEVSINCPSPSHVLAEVERRCNHRLNCEVPAGNEVFGDPCVGILKYLKVSYRCIEEPLKTVTACDQEPATAHISCTRGESIKINSATYGRTRSDVCNKRGLRLTTLTCQVDPLKVTNTLIDRCDGKPYCSTHAVNDVAKPLGDPCIGVFHHLDVNYLCL